VSIHRSKNSAPPRSPSPSTDILHVIFHELRTPLSSIQGYASLLLSGELGAVAPQQREVIERLHDLTGYLTSLITNLNQWVKLAEGPSQIGWEPVDVLQLVRSVCDHLQVEAKRKGVRLTVALPAQMPLLWAERAGLTQVLINLLTNAIKFTPTKGMVTVSVQEARRTVRLTVSDTGVGIARSARPSLFREFYHEDRPEVGAVGGTGLGLAIVKRITERHHGTVTITSRPKHGSTFQVTLPRHTDQEVMQEILEQSLQAARSRHEQVTVLRIEAKAAADPTNGVSLTFYTQLHRLVQETLRADDRCFQVKSECSLLMIVVARTHLEGARRMAARLVKRMNEDALLQRVPGFQLKIGIAAYPTHASRAPQLLKIARQHMVLMEAR